MGERVAVFVDGSNFYFGCKDLLGNAQINFYKLSQILVTPQRELIRTYYYNAPVHRDSDENRYQNQQRFFERLKITKYLDLRLGRLINRSGVFVEKGIDVSIAIDMLTLAWNNVYDTAILVSGDGDFAAAVKSVKDRGKHVENAYFRSSQSKALRDACDIEVELTSALLKRCHI
jgi:uncharacterized LabA/DUF88 family protein